MDFAVPAVAELHNCAWLAAVLHDRRQHGAQVESYQQVAGSAWTPAGNSASLHPNTTLPTHAPLVIANRVWEGTAAAQLAFLLSIPRQLLACFTALAFKLQPSAHRRSHILKCRHIQLQAIQ
jgi:hypothetical protein